VVQHTVRNINFLKQ